MRKLLWLLSIFVLFPCVVHSVDIVVNGKVGKVIADKPILDTTYYKPADSVFTDTLRMGQAIIDAHRARKQESYKTVMAHEDRVATNVTRLMGMRAKLQAWGFKDESDVINQSKKTAEKAGLKLGDKGYWQ